MEAPRASTSFQPLLALPLSAQARALPGLSAPHSQIPLSSHSPSVGFSDLFILSSPYLAPSRDTHYPSGPPPSCSLVPADIGPRGSAGQQEPHLAPFLIPSALGLPSDPSSRYHSINQTILVSLPERCHFFHLQPFPHPLPIPPRLLLSLESPRPSSGALPTHSPPRTLF